jgi:hypothetical protein
MNRPSDAASMDSETKGHAFDLCYRNAAVSRPELAACNKTWLERLDANVHYRTDI